MSRVRQRDSKDERISASRSSCISGLVFEVPLHLTGFFYPVFHERAEHTGSLGAGLVIEPGLKCVVDEGEGVWFGGEKIDSGPAAHIYAELGRGFSINLTGSCIPGAGYAFSASSSIAVAACFALAGRINTLDAALKAHVSEVKHGTGLGDVLSIWDGFGLALRKSPGAPGIGEVESIKINEEVVVLTSELGKLPTRDLLSIHLEKIIEAGKKAYRLFLENPNLELFLTLSNSFSRALGLVDEKVEEIVKPVSSMLLGWYVKKRVLVLVAERRDAAEVAKNIGSYLPVVRVFRPGEVEWRRYLETIPATRRS
ncbi:MAG: hypothetical protein RMJ28_02035 [Nitrososphaerota archaeon]|nr:hypothetical protein [Candidatus Calditenuaceae archaeon]MDW8073003.1 hypothetical protein [Nitrososphaerota archaeon]